MKRTITLLMIAVGLCIQTLQIWASDEPYRERGTSGLLRYAVYNNQWLQPKDGGAVYVALTGLEPEAKGDVIIPEKIDGFEVYGIDDNAFATCEGVESITIPKTVVHLRPGTLNRCKGLKNIHVAEDHPAFASVEGVMVSKDKTKLLAVGSGREGEYKVPDTITSIGPGAFSHCIGLKSIVIPKSVTDIGGHQGEVFLGCTSLRRIDLPDTLTNIGQKSFQDCGSLQQVTVPPKVTAIPFGLFWRCGNLTKVALPDGITSIGNYAFADCQKLIMRRFPASLKTIGACAFKDCKSLKVALPKSVTKIGRGAFRGTGVANKPLESDR